MDSTSTSDAGTTSPSGSSTAWLRRDAHLVPRSRAAVGGLLTGPAVVFAALLYNSLAVFGFHTLVSRELGPSRYGALGAVLAITVLVPIVRGAFNVALIREVVAHPATTCWDARGIRRHLSLAIGALVVFGVAMGPLLESYLHLHSIVPVLMLVAFAAAVLAGTVPSSVLMGQHRYRTVAVALGVTATLRLALGVVCARLFGLSGALAAYAMAEGAFTLLLVLADHKARQQSTVRRDLRLPRVAVGLAFVSYASMWVLSGEDQFLARHLLPATGSGFYVAASLAGSIALWIPYHVASSLYPHLADEASSRSNGARRFATGAAITGALALGAAAALMLVPGVTIRVLFGSAFGPARSVLVLLAVSNAAQGVVYFLLQHQLASERKTGIVPWIAVCATAVGIYAYHSSPTVIAVTPVIVGIALLVTMAAISGRLALAQHRLTAPAPVATCAAITIEPAFDASPLGATRKPGPPGRWCTTSDVSTSACPPDAAQP